MAETGHVTDDVTIPHYTALARSLLGDPGASLQPTCYPRKVRGMSRLSPTDLGKYLGFPTSLGTLVGQV